MTNDREGEKRKLNNLDLRVNRGFELMINKSNRRDNSSKPKTFQIRFGKMLSLFSREMHINFDFYFNIIKK
jgi:hypothetical protein